jgi:hypothetical protein
VQIPVEPRAQAGFTYLEIAGEGPAGRCHHPFVLEPRLD